MMPSTHVQCLPRILTRVVGVVYCLALSSVNDAGEWAGEKTMGERGSQTTTTSVPSRLLPGTSHRELTLIGGPQVRDLFIGTLTHEYRGKFLTDDHVLVFEYLLDDLGILAAEDDEALRFLIQASDPAFWEVRASWPVLAEWWWYFSAGRHHHRLAGAAVSALGLSRRPEALAHLRSMRLRQWKEVRELAHAVEYGVSRWEVLNRESPVYLRDLLRRRKGPRTSVELNRATLAWRESPEGRDWGAWSEGNSDR